MQKEIIISWFATDKNNTVKAEHRESLEKSTESQIVQALSDGLFSGEIVKRISDGAKDTLYKGFWSAEERVLQ